MEVTEQMRIELEFMGSILEALHENYPPTNNPMELEMRGRWIIKFIEWWYGSKKNIVEGLDAWIPLKEIIKKDYEDMLERAKKIIENSYFDTKRTMSIHI